MTNIDGFDNRDDNPEGTSAQKREALQRYWIRQIERYEKQFQKFTLAGEKIMRQYRKQEENKLGRRFAMLWANTDVLRPAVYARVPVPIVQRRWKEKDDAGMLASELQERNLNYEIEQGKFHDVMCQCRDDMLLPGRGSMWVRMKDDDGYKSISWDYVNWKDFGHSLARTWQEVTAVWRKVYMTKRELADRFFDGNMDDDELRQVELDQRSDSESSENANPAVTAGQAKATVYEIWDKKSKKIVFIAKRGTYPLEISTPYLDLKRFWPVPKPLYATVPTESLEPTPDYQYYKDQAEEIDVLTGRIAALSDSLKLVGFYPSGENESDIATALSPGVENKMIAVDNWAAFAEKGGTAGITFLPIKEVVDTVTACIQLRTQLIQDVFQIMGLSDIQRGASNPEETLGAQQLKAQYGSNRLKSKRDEIARFAQEALEIAAEIIAENFPPEQVLAVANRENVQGDLAAAAFQLLKDDHLRCFRIDIETDSTIYPDENAEKAARNEFLGAVAQFFQQAAPMVQAVPSAMPLVQELLMFVVRGYRVARELEGVIEQTMNQMMSDLQNQQQSGGQPDPVEMAKIENDKQRIAIEDRKVSGELGIKQIELKHKIVDSANQHGLAKQQAVHQAGMDQQKHQLDMHQSQQQHEMGMQQMQQQQGMNDHQMMMDGQKNQLAQDQFGHQVRQDQFNNSMQANADLGQEEQGQGGPGPLAQALMAMAQAITAMVQGQQQQTQMLAQALTAPKHSQVHRDPATGEVIGATQHTVSQG